MFDRKTGRVLAILIIGILLSLSRLDAADAEGGNGIIKPPEGTTVDGSVYVDGIADDPNFAVWQLDLLPGGNEKQAILLARSTSPNKTVDTFKKLDTTAYPNGAYRLRLRVIKNDGNYEEYFVSITISNAALVTSNGVTSPPDGATVSCSVPIKGIANDTDFRKWQLDLLVGGDENRVIFVDRGFSPNKTDGTFTQLDTTAYPDGTHRLRLRVVKRDGNYESYFSWITIDNRTTASRLIPNVCNCAAINSNAPPPGPNGITNPKDGASVRGIILVCGIADDPNFVAWQLDLLFGGDERQAVMIAQAKNRNKSGAPFTQLDTSVLPDGKYGLRLSVNRTDSTVDRSTTMISIANSISEIETQSVSDPGTPPSKYPVRIRLDPTLEFAQ